MITLNIHSLKNDIIDRDVLLLHSSFQILVDFVELEYGLDYHSHIDGFQVEATALYKWWLNRKNDPWTDAELTYEKDTEMLIRLMKIRKYLWT